MDYSVKLCACPQSGISELPASFAMAISGVALVLSLGTHVSSLHWLRSRRETVSVFLGTLRGVLFPKTEKEKRVAVLIEEKRLAMCLVLADAFFVSQFGSAMLLMVSAAAFFGLFPREPMYLAYYCVVTTICALAWIGFLFQKKLNVTSMNLLIYAMFLLVGVPPVFATSLESYHFAIGWARALQLLLSIVGPDMSHFLPVNLLHLAWQLWVIFKNPGLRDDLVENLVLSLVTVGYNLLMRIGATALFKDRGEAILQALQSSNSEGTVRALISVMTDALVALREDLTLQEDSPPLAALLLGTPSIVARQGQTMSRFLMADNVDRFNQFVLSGSSASKARQINIDFRDSSGNRVRTQIYHVCLKDQLDGHLTHLIGVVEDSREQSLGPSLDGLSEGGFSRQTSNVDGSTVLNISGGLGAFPILDHGGKFILFGLELKLVQAHVLHMLEPGTNSPTLEYFREGASPSPATSSRPKRSDQLKMMEGKWKIAMPDAPPMLIQGGVATVQLSMQILRDPNINLGLQGLPVRLRPERPLQVPTRSRQSLPQISWHGSARPERIHSAPACTLDDRAEGPESSDSLKEVSDAHASIGRRAELPRARSFVDSDPRALRDPKFQGVLVDLKSEAMSLPGQIPQGNQGSDP